MDVWTAASVAEWLDTSVQLQQRSMQLARERRGGWVGGEGEKADGDAAPRWVCPSLQSVQKGEASAHTTPPKAPTDAAAATRWGGVRTGGGAERAECPRSTRSSGASKAEGVGGGETGE